MDKIIPWIGPQIKRFAANLLEIDTAVEEETRARADIEDQVATSERKGSFLKLIVPSLSGIVFISIAMPEK